jgi:sRNA-binding protein
MTSPTDESSKTRWEPDFSVSAQRTLGQLRKLFPKAFGSVRPLKIGITSDIVARTAMTSEQVCEFMRFYCTLPAYYRAQLREGAVRYDLDGQRVGAVSIEERMHASLGLERQWAERRVRRRELAFKAALLEPTIIPDEDQP